MGDGGEHLLANQVAVLQRDVKRQSSIYSIYIVYSLSADVCGQDNNFDKRKYSLSLSPIVISPLFFQLISRRDKDVIHLPPHQHLSPFI